MKTKIAIVGGGAWGTALAALSSDNDRPAEIFIRNSNVVDEINTYHENKSYLPSIKLNTTLVAKEIADLHKLDTNYIIWVVPTQFSRAMAEEYKDILTGKHILIASKGIEIDTGKLIIDIMADVVDAHYSILSGPSFAIEVAQKKTTAVSVGSKLHKNAAWWQEQLSNDYFRCYVSTDIAGIQVGGATKNVIAIAAGIAEGLSLSDNAKAALISRGLLETARLGMAYGAQRETFLGLAGLGDLVLTTTGDKSRNRQMGQFLAQGLTVQDVLNKVNTVAEGVYTAKAIYNIANKLNIEMPISTEVYNIIYNGKDPKQSLKDLMSRPLTADEIV